MRSDWGPAGGRVVLQLGFRGQLILTCTFAVSTVLGGFAVFFPSLVFLRWVLVGRIIAYKRRRRSRPLRLEKRLHCKMPDLRLVRTLCLQLRFKLRTLPFNRPGRLSLEFRQNWLLSSHRQFKLLSPRNGRPQVLLRSPRLCRIPPL